MHPSNPGRSVSILIGIMAILFLVTTVQSCTGVMKGKVYSVKDGDTIVLSYNWNSVMIRLADIDCPERGQPYWREAKIFVSSLVWREKVRVDVVGTADWSRMIGVVMLSDGRNLSRVLVRNGLAWWYPKYSDDSTYAVLEKEARDKGLGIWQNDNPIPPWIFREKGKSKKNG